MYLSWSNYLPNFGWIFFGSDTITYDWVIRSGFYRGLVSMVLRDAPYSGIFVMTYNRSKNALSGKMLPDGAMLWIIQTTAILRDCWIWQCALCLRVPSHLLSPSQRTSLRPTGSYLRKEMIIYSRFFEDYTKFVKEMFGNFRFDKSNSFQIEGIAGYFRGCTLRITRKMITSTIVWVNYDYFVRALLPWLPFDFGEISDLDLFGSLDWEILCVESAIIFV